MIYDFTVFEWPEMFRPTQDNIQDVIKWIMLKRPGARDVIIEMTEEDRACLNKHLGPKDGRHGVSFDAMMSVNRHLGTFVGIKEVYLLMGVRIYITQKAEVRYERYNETSGGVGKPS